MAKVPHEIKEKSRVSKEEWREWTKTVWHVANTSDPDHPAVFPVEIPHRLIKLFSFVGETVLDPFAGVGNTAHAALPLGRNAMCIEQNEMFAKRILDDAPATTEAAALSVTVGDSRDMSSIADGSVDLIVTSPPYWNKADYGGNGSNLGDVDGYRQFFNDIEPVWKECFRILQPGRKLCLVTANVSQHTDHGLLTFPLAADFVVALRDLGFLVVGESIWSKDGTGGRWGSWGSQRPIFGSYPYPPNFLFKTLHEHILVFSKPSGRRIRGPKALPYDELMATASS
ncbi:MAG: site-specific DNA-methyltransferase [Acidimicrobiaceae bacterium]|nr:site-specific DNA-methyltransferase [Acidimicrobiaceae bacterium]